MTPVDDSVLARTSEFHDTFMRMLRSGFEPITMVFHRKTPGAAGYDTSSFRLVVSADVDPVTLYTHIRETLDTAKECSPESPDGQPILPERAAVPDGKVVSLCASRKRLLEKRASALASSYFGEKRGEHEET